MPFFIIRNQNAKVGNQEISGVIGKFGLGVQNEAGQRLTQFYQEKALVRANTFFQLHFVFLGQVKVKVLVVQLCQTLCNHRNCSPPGSLIPGIHQARLLEWVAISFSNV